MNITALDLQPGDTLNLFDNTTPAEFVCWLADGPFERGQYPTGLVYFSGHFHAFEPSMYATMDTQEYDVFEVERQPRPVTALERQAAVNLRAKYREEVFSSYYYDTERR